jgi:hypothetical protein
MITYKTFRPSQFDSHINFDEEREDWLVGPCSHNRDSDLLTESNWEALIKALGGESEHVEIHRFGHWGNGWFEIILIKPDTDAAKTAQECADSLENYPSLDDNLNSDKQHEADYEYWKSMSLRERIEVCKKRNVSIFAARKDDSIPERVYDYLSERV